MYAERLLPGAVKSQPPPGAAAGYCGAYEGFTLAVITLLLVILVGIPVLLWLT